MLSVGGDMANANGYGQYRQIRINTASPGKLILLLYQGAIKALKKSVELIDRKDYAGKGECLIKAQDIVMELNLALDMDVGGEISHSLRRLYLYIYRRLVDANLNLDKDAIQETIRIMENLYDAWGTAVQDAEGSIQGNVAPSRLSIMG